MADKDIVIEWLGSAARRIRLNERVESVSRMCVSLLLLALAWYAMRAVIRTPQVASAIFPLFVIAAVAVLVYFAWRMLRGPDRALAAALVDARAGLNNEVTSALWFTSDVVGDEFVGAHLARAARTVSKLNPVHLIPFVLPRSVPLAAGLLLTTAVAAWLSTAYVGSGEQDHASAPASQRSDRVALMSEYNEDTGNSEQFADDRAAGAWLKVEQLARELRAGPDTDRVAEAIAARDATNAARLLAGIRREQTTQAASGKVARPETEQMSATLAQNIVERLQSLLDQGGGWSGGSKTDSSGDATDRLTEQVTRELRAEMDDAQDSLPGEMSPEEQILNTTLQAMSRESTGGREAIRGEANPMQGLGRTSVGSGAMGRRIGTTTGGAGDGEEPTGNPQGNAEAEPVLGQKTMRLRLQMQTVKIDQTQSDDADGNSEESFYAATQAQAAKTAYENIIAEQIGGSEQTTGSEQLPVAYRDAVRQYTVRQHERESASRP